jgi:hypothetical protein
MGTITIVPHTIVYFIYINTLTYDCDVDLFTLVNLRNTYNQIVPIIKAVAIMIVNIPNKLPQH